MRRGKVAAIWSVLAFLFVGSGLLASIAWFNSGRNEVDVKINGSVVEERFHCGDGTAEHPYVITRPIHYYHLVEFFQRETELTSTSRFGTDYLYFQVGYDLNNDGELEVYEYDDQGIYTGTENNSSASTSESGLKISKTLNMAYYSGTNALMPIGTNEVPFIGSFDGRADEGISISNLNIHCAEKVSINNSPVNRAASDIGIFGYLADEDDHSNPTIIKNAKFNGVTIDLTDIAKTVADSQTSFDHEDSHSGQPFVGIVAGHVHTYSNYYATGPRYASPLRDVYVSNASITGGNADVSIRSNYGYIGKVDYIDGEASTSVASQVTTLNGGDGQGNNFGGSIDMLSLYNRLHKVYNEESYDNGDYSVNIITGPDGTIRREKIEPFSGSTPLNRYANYANNDFSYTFNKDYYAGTNQDIYYLYGDVSSVNATTTENHYTEANQNVTSNKLKIIQSASGYYFKAGANYLKIPQLSSLNNTTQVQSATTIGGASLFSREANGSGYRYYVNQTINGANRKVYFGFGSQKTGTSLTVLCVSMWTSTSEANVKKYTTWYTDGTGVYHYRTRPASQSDSTKCYLCYSGSNFVSYIGGTTGTKATLETQTDDHYLSALQDGSCLSTADEASATIWYFEDNKIFTIYDNKIYYLYFTGSGIGIKHLLPKSSAPSFSFSNGVLSFSSSGTTYYLDLSRPSLLNTSQTTNTVMNSLGAASLNNQAYVTSSSSSSSSVPTYFPSTYIPLSVSAANIYSTLPFNTGYIMSGRTYENSDNLTKGYNSGDVRVSRYAMSNISTAMGQSTYSDSKLYAITATSNSDYALITDSHNNGAAPGATAPSGLNGISGRKASTTLNRYNNWSEDDENHTGAREAMGKVFTDDSDNIYGLHFMNASVSKTDAVTIPNAKINNTTYSSGLVMPKDCIDFYVKKKGYIVFFAGTYFLGNNCFFSLHKIERNSDNSLKEIIPIETIYKDSSNNYSYNPSSTSGLTKVFDTAVLTSPTKFIQNAVYYFEIPVGAGEFALGSVSGMNGAYLMYLDISANGSETTYNEANQIGDSPLFTQIDFQTGTYVINSCFNVAYVIPAGASKGTFSISISCGTVIHNNYSYTSYELEIINTTGSSFEISCLLMDNDSDPNNAYYYMYAIKYNTGTRTEHFSSNTFTGASSGTTMTPTYS